ncbi:MAG: autotransporter-associated beta strand repeat-containing protein [Candidatus Marinimicrobia bacterium]|nr:autotransporter-associated beta strand repeat-containing protein [Candidatus Neomarinimicrobiota bacterium]
MKTNGRAGSKMSLIPTACVVLAAVLFLASQPTAQAEDPNYWTGAGGGNPALWSNNSNWSLGVLPNSIDAIAVFYNSYTGLSNPIRMHGSRSVNQLNFSADADADVTISLTSAAGTTGQILNFEVNSDLQAPQINVDADATGNFQLGGTGDTELYLRARTGLTINHAGSGTLTFGQMLNTLGTVGATVTKNGTGTLIFAADNDYTGTTTVNGGVLLVNGDTTAATGAVSVNNGATLGGTGTVGGNITLYAGGTVAAGASIGELTVQDLTIQDGGILDFELTSNATPGTTYDRLVGDNLYLPSGGTVNLKLSGFGVQSITGGDSFTLFSGTVHDFGTTTVNIVNDTDWTGGWQVSEGSSLVLTAVIPEPSTLGLLVFAALCGFIRWRRRG